jgi:hypothetical protein
MSPKYQSYAELRERHSDYIARLRCERRPEKIRYYENQLTIILVELSNRGRRACVTDGRE